MTQPPLYQRSPRLYPEVPSAEVEIPAPPPVPPAPTVSLGSVLAMLIPGLIAAGATFFIARAQGQPAWISLGFSLPMMVASAIIQAVIFLAQRRKREATLRGRTAKYREILEQHGHQFRQAREKQLLALTQVSPEPGECLRRAQERQPRLWERSPRDADFLALRLGLGRLPFCLTIKTPREPLTLEPDPLYGEVEALAAQFAQVDGAPVLLPLPGLGAVGVVGNRVRVLATARQLAVQAVAGHSPEDLKVVAVFPAEEAEEWAWLRWLPHVWSADRSVRWLAADRDSASDLLSDLQDLLSRRKRQQASGSVAPQSATPQVPAFLIFLADPRLAEKHPALPMLLRDGAALGAYTVILTERKEELPMECQGIVERSEGAGQLVLTAPGTVPTLFAPDEGSLELAERLARALAPVRLNQMAAPAEIPHAVTLLQVLGLDRVDELDAVRRWTEAEPFRSLGVPVGVRAGGEPLILDLHERAHGPHGLVAGATGSGKSELLQALIAALAVQFHPHDLAFVMIDYKGGGMANLFSDLPHLVGTITNLEGNLAKRALAALKAELKRRQRLLGEAGVNHIDDYIKSRRKGRALEPIPHLVLVVDEFAELKTEQPDFMRELVSAVRVGRSLGVHLILATQKPAGVVDEQIWSNTRFRLCLRVERPSDSQEVIKCPDAASLTRPGQAYVQVGNDELLEQFQAAYSGAPYRPGTAGEGDPLEIAEVGLNGRRYRLSSRPAAPPGTESESQLQVLVRHLAAEAAREAITRLPGPWLPPLPDTVTLDQLTLPDMSWVAPVVGLLDDPENQLQQPLRLDLGKEGHLALYGAPGMGKTTFLLTLATALARTHSPQDLHLYALDATGRSLGLLRDLPHCGGVVLGDEDERLDRLMRLLMAELERRKELLAAAGVNTLAAYRQIAGGNPLPAVVMLVDNYPAFAAAHAEADDLLTQVAREGGNLGLHLVLTAGSPSQIRSRMAGSITLTATLALADRSEYSAAVGRTGGLEPVPTPGRGLIKGTPPLEFQTALPVPGETEWERTAALRAMYGQMNDAWTGVRPKPVRTLPEVVELSDVLAESGPAAGTAVPVGLDVTTLEPFRVDLQEGPHFLITGPSESGKTTLLRSWLLSLTAARSPDELHLYLIDQGAGGLAPLKRLPHVQAHAADSGQADSVLDEVGRLLAERTGRFPLMIVAIDDVETFRDSASSTARDRVEQWLRKERSPGFHLLAAGHSGALSQYSYEGLFKALKDLQTGFLLGSTDHGDLSLLNLRLPSGESGKSLDPGMGLYARRGKYRKFKAALSGRGLEEDGTDLSPARRALETGGRS